MRIATWNVNSLNARLEKVTGWLGDVAPDVVCLQETKMADDAFPALAFEELGYTCVHHGEGRWNGVAILSRLGLEDPRVGFADGGPPDAEARIVWATCGGVRVASVYVPNGRALDDDHYVYKLGWLERLRAHLDAALDPAEEVAVLGDYNIAPTDADVWDIDFFDGMTHVSVPEREAFTDLLEWGMHDALRETHPDAEGLFTYWDYKAGRFHKREGMRIDHVLVTAPLRERLEWVVVDRNARKGDKPSDHAPVVAQFA